MNKKQLRTVLKLLEKASNVEKKKRKDYIKSCSNDEIHAICGATKNLLDGNFDMSTSKKSYLKKKLKPHQCKIRYLSDPRKSIKKKRILLEKEQFGAGVFTALATVAIPALIAALGG